MNNKEYQICVRCVMDTSDPGISFNGKGECNLCSEFLSKRAKYNYHGKESDAQFKKLIADMKRAGRGKEYDCIVGLSGGVDSSYAAYLCKISDLRILTVHVDNGWNSEEAVLNIKNIAQKLQIDYESYVLDWEQFKDLQLSFLNASVPEAETPTDVALLGAVHQVAQKYGVKYIISGGNFATEGILPKFWHYNAKDSKYLKSIQNKFGSKNLRGFPLFGFLKEMYYKLVKGIKIIYILNYVPYAKDKAMDLLKNELDWRYYGGKHYESLYTGFIQSYYLNKKFGIDYRRATFSTQICTGELSRDEAIEKLKTRAFTEEKVQREKEYVSKKLGITIQEFETIINLPPKWYIDYPNDERGLNVIYNTYRKLFRKDKLGNF